MKNLMNIMKNLASKIPIQTSLFLAGLFFLALASFIFNLIVGFYVVGAILIVLALIINSEKRGGK
ncbi:hypothetical protein B8W96_11045 [Lentilactobacillus parakefiri]|nr:hypothetical protein B8W96_11045 [Lentilactobacillus parakefiri]